MLAMSAATMVVLLVVGRWAFRAVERDAADWL
jgi:hypothetical protein